MLCSNQLSYIAFVLLSAAIVLQSRDRSLPKGREFWRFRPEMSRSDVKPEENNVAVLNHVFLALQAPFADILGTGFTPVFDKIRIGNYLGTNKPSLEIGVDYAGGSRGGSTLLNGPGTHCFLASREVGL